VKFIKSSELGIGFYHGDRRGRTEFFTESAHCAERAAGTLLIIACGRQ